MTSRKSMRELWRSRSLFAVSLVLSSASLFAIPALADDQGYYGSRSPLVIGSEGCFMAGGTVITTLGDFVPMNPTSAGQTLHGDHTYVQFQIPHGDRKQNSAVM